MTEGVTNPADLLKKGEATRTRLLLYYCWNRRPLLGAFRTLGNRSEARGKSRTGFRSLEASSGNYLTKMIGHMDRFPTAAVGSS